VLAVELLLHPDDSALRLNGCGMAIVNPPWQIERKLEPILDDLPELLQQGRHGRTQVIWLAGPD
jgi:23S rRNA (adenine2030-N6)-methyltransferase